jgi:hypothetical protein
MKKALILGLIGLLAAGAIAAVASVTVFAQDATPTPETTEEQQVRHPFLRWRLDGTALEAAAGVLGMTTDELKTRLQDGATLEELADEAGVDLEDVRTAIQEARIEATRAAIQQAVVDGEMSQEKADWLLEGLDKGYWSGHRFGPRGRVGAFGFGDFGLRPDRGIELPDVDS